MTAAPGLTLGVATERMQSARWTRLRQLRRSPLAFTAACVLVVLVVIAVTGPLFASAPGNQQNLNLRFQAPFTLKYGGWFVLGGDSLGRPMLAQLILGTRTTFIVAAASVGCAAVVGMATGLVSGYFGGWLDAAVMRLGDILMTIPSLLLALVVLYVLSPSVLNLIMVLAVTRLPIYMRTARAQTLSVREQVFIEASRSIGTRTSRIIMRDIRPLIVPTILTVAMLEVATVILAAAGLSFLGVGLQRPSVDWGLMVADGRDYLTNAWWDTVFPGIMIVITAMSANILSNWLRATGAGGQQASSIAVVAAAVTDDGRGAAAAAAGGEVTP